MSFASLQLPEHMLRGSALAEKYHTDGYLEALDRETLWYDAIWSKGVIYLVCPPLHGLRRKLRRARFRADGVPVKVRAIRRYKRHDVVELSASQKVAGLNVYLDGWRGESAVNAAEPERFSGQDVLFYINKNNDLRWIVEHARFHRYHHGVRALIVMDNGSDAYSPEDIEAALAPVGLDVCVLDAPFKYGPIGKPPYRRMEKFMQTALFNVLRLRFLGAAAGILSVDIDELVMPGPMSVFDAARKSRLGFVQIRGEWREPETGSSGPFSHVDHLYRRVPADTCPPKWCMVPESRLFNWSWDVHGIERLPFLHTRTHPDFWFAHCRGVTTGWKKAKRLEATRGSERDSEMQAAFEVLPET